MEIMTQSSSTSDLEKMHALAVRLNLGERAHGVLWTEHAILDVIKKRPNNIIRRPQKHVLWLAVMMVYDQGSLFLLTVVFSSTTLWYIPTIPECLLQSKLMTIRVCVNKMARQIDRNKVDVTEVEA
jgi:hypothetical protein